MSWVFFRCYHDDLNFGLGFCFIQMKVMNLKWDLDYGAGCGEFRICDFVVF